MAKKEFIRDNDKIRNCASNVAKMNIFQYVCWDFTNFFKEMWKQLKNVVIETITNLAVLILIILFPILIFIRAFINIHKARKEIKEYEKEQEIEEKESE